MNSALGGSNAFHTAKNSEMVVGNNDALSNYNKTPIQNGMMSASGMSGVKLNKNQKSTL